MSTGYERTGRTDQKARTRAALVDATRRLLAEGVTPTVERAADHARISRTTAYRYFPNRRSLLLATYPELDTGSLLDADAPADVRARLKLALERLTQQLLDHEPELRAQLRLALDPDAPERRTLALRQGRAIGWLEDALAPLRESMPPRKLRRLVLAIRATVGIEALVWLTDVAGLSRKEATGLMRSSARTLLDAALQDAAADGHGAP